MIEDNANSSLRVAEPEELIPGRRVLFNINSPCSANDLRRVRFVGSNVFGSIIVVNGEQQHLYIAG
jgi:hypothetical protein